MKRRFLSPIKQDPGYCLALGSALAYTCYDVALRALIGNLTVWGLLLIRGLLGIVLVLYLTRIKKFSPWGTQPKVLVAAGFFIFSASILGTLAIASIPLYQALILIYLYPVFTLLLAMPLNGEKVTVRDFSLAVLALFGCLILVWPDDAVGLELNLGHLCGVGAAFFYSLGQVFIRRLGDGNTGLEPNFYYSLYAAILSIPLALLLGSHLGFNGSTGLLSGLVLAVMGITAQVSGYAALRWLPGFKVGLIAYLEVFLGSLISWLVFQDPLSFRAVFGGLIIVAVVFQLRRPVPAKK